MEATSIVKGTKNLEAAKTLVDWSVSEKAMKLYNEGYAVTAIMNFMPAAFARAGTVRLGGLELACAVDDVPAGTGLTVAIRPEDVRVHGVTGSEENVFLAPIKAMEFLGSFFRVDLAGDDLDGVTLRADLAVDLVRRLDLAEGQSLSVVRPRRRLRVYPGPSAVA